jgi:hypothetical protein
MRVCYKSVFIVRMRSEQIYMTLYLYYLYKINMFHATSYSAA